MSIISELQANTLLKNDKMGKSESSGEILNNTGTMEYQKTSRQLSVSFRYFEELIGILLDCRLTFLIKTPIIGTCSSGKSRGQKRRARNP